MKRSIALLVMVVLLVSLFIGCGSSSTVKNATSVDATSAEATNVDAASAAASTEPAKPADPVTLSVWDLRTEGVSAKMIDKIIADFSKANEGIKVKRTSFKVDDLSNTIKPAINSGKGPDVFSYDAGAGYLGVLAKAGLALDLTPYSEKYGWNDRFIDWALNRGVYDGKLYGIANELELLGVFYNKKLFADMGVQTPKTYDEFLDICKKFKDKGMNPVILDDKDQWPGFHYESLWLNSNVGPKRVGDAITNKAAWNQPEFGEALDKLRDLIKMGYTTAKPLAVGYDDANKEFYAGKGAMRPTGTWMVGAMVDKMKDNVGFFYLPPMKSDVPMSAPGGLGEAVVVNAKSANPEAAVKYVDYMFSKDAVKTWYEAGYIPSLKNVDYSSFKLSVLFIDILNNVNNATDLGHNIDVLMPPKVNDKTKNFVQELIAGKKSGQQCMDIKQKIFEEEIKAGNYTP
jgi:raffinose/stachyose/melibiose transport system substrate-binding protein